MKILTCREMRLVEAAAAADGLDYLRLTENAGSAAARVMFSSRATVKKYFSVRNSTGPHLLFSPTISWPQWGRKCDMCEMYVSA